MAEYGFLLDMELTISMGADVNEYIMKIEDRHHFTMLSQQAVSIHAAFGFKPVDIIPYYRNKGRVSNEYVIIGIISLHN